MRHIDFSEFWLSHARKGHFVLESGLHSDTWLDLDSLFLDSSALIAQVETLAAMIAPYQVSAICGPLVGGAFLAQMVATRLGVRFYFAEHVSFNATEGLFQARYRLPMRQRQSAASETFAIVDDAISGGSSVRATFEDLRSLGAKIKVVGTLLVQGNRAAAYFSRFDLPVIGCTATETMMWEPNTCPLCGEGVSLDAA